MKVLKKLNKFILVFAMMFSISLTSLNLNTINAVSYTHLIQKQDIGKIIKLDHLTRIEK